MKHVYEIVPAEFEHIAPIAGNARQADVDEVAAASGRTCAQALHTGLIVSQQPLTGLIDGVPACMFGIAPASRAYNLGTPWMIGCELIDQHALAFLRRSKGAFYPLAQHFSELENYVDARHTAAIRWSRWLGFDFDAAKPYGIARLPFHRFYMKA